MGNFKNIIDKDGEHVDTVWNYMKKQLLLKILFFNYPLCFCIFLSQQEYFSQFKELFIHSLFINIHEHSYLHRWSECCVWKGVEQENLTHYWRWLHFITSMDRTITNYELYVGVSIKCNTHHLRLYSPYALLLFLGIHLNGGIFHL